MRHYLQWEMRQLPGMVALLDERRCANVVRSAAAKLRYYYPDDVRFFGGSAKPCPDSAADRHDESLDQLGYPLLCEPPPPSRRQRVQSLLLKYVERQVGGARPARRA